MSEGELWPVNHRWPIIKLLPRQCLGEMAKYGGDAESSDQRTL